jgi:Domain of unknown function (DUF6475)
VNESQPPKAFSERLAAVYAFYGKVFSRQILSVWWGALRNYDDAAVADALNRHAIDPDHGQFLPKPADLVRLMCGSTQDTALVAWSNVERAIRSVGIYQSIVFDDAITHAVINDMGGWVKLCGVTEDELPFRAKEFENRYRGYRTRGHIDSYPRHLAGLAEGQNSAGGFKVEPPIMIGNHDRCLEVYRGGRESVAIWLKPIPLAELFEEKAA